MAFIGVDLHTNSFTICRLRDDGTEGFETFALSASALQAFCLSLDANDDIAVEATGNTAWFCDEIRPCVGRVVVVNPRQFQVIRKSVNKTDKNDAQALAFFLSKDMLPETRLKSTAESELSSLVATRDVFVKQRTMLLNKIHAMFVRRGTKLKKEGLASEKRMRELDVSQFTALEQVELNALRKQALGLTETLGELDKAIEAAGADLPDHEGISSIKRGSGRARQRCCWRESAISMTSQAPTSWRPMSASCQRSASPTKPTTEGVSPSAATS
jgi:transposase